MFLAMLLILLLHLIVHAFKSHVLNSNGKVEIYGLFIVLLFE